MANLGYSEGLQSLMDDMNWLICVKANHKLRFRDPRGYDDMSSWIDTGARTLNNKESSKRAADFVRKTCMALAQELPRCAALPVHAALQEKVDEMCQGILRLARIYDDDPKKEIWGKSMRDSIRLLRPGELPSAPEDI